MFGGVEAGGTKFVCVIGTGPDDIAETQRIDVAGPGRRAGPAGTLNLAERAAGRGAGVAG